jgi:hypothetical protein
MDIATAKAKYDAACREQNEANSESSRILRQSAGLRLTDRKFKASRARVKSAATAVATTKATLDAARRAAGGR